MTQEVGFADKEAPSYVGPQIDHLGPLDRPYRKGYLELSGCSLDSAF